MRQDQDNMPLLAEVGQENQYSEVSDEATPGTQTTRLQLIGNKAGLVITLIAMVPPGGFGCVFVDHQWLQDLSLYWRIPLNIAIFFSATIGKFAIVHIYNREACKEFLKIFATSETSIRVRAGQFFIAQEWHDISNQEEWAKWKKNLAKLLLCVNKVMTLNASLLFAGLAGVSLRGIPGIPDSGMSSLLRSYNMDAMDRFASGLEHPACYSFFMLFSFIANVLTFGNVHKGALVSIKQALERLGQKKDLALLFVDAVMITVVMIGLINFFTLAAYAYRNILDYHGVTDPTSKSFVGVLSCLSLSSFVVTIIPKAVDDFIAWLRGGYHLSSKEALIVLAIIVTTVLGSTPNVEQSVLADENLFIILCAGFASVVLETPGLIGLWLAGKPVAQQSIQSFDKRSNFFNSDSNNSSDAAIELSLDLSTNTNYST